MRALVAGALGLLSFSRAFGIDVAPVVHQFPASSALGAVQMIALDDEIWVAEPNANGFARVANDGSITQLRVPTPGSRPLAIARDTLGFGQVVFTDVGTNRIGVIDGSGVLTAYDIPTPASNPRGVAVLTGEIWFTEYDGNRIGRVQPGAPNPIVEFALPTFNAGLLGIAFGPGAAPNTYDMWFTEFLANKIGRIDANGNVTEYAIPTPNSGPTAITFSIDQLGNPVLYFTESRANKIGKITPSGAMTEYPIPTPASSPTDIVPGYEGIWFAERAVGKLGLLAADGTIREFSLNPGTRPEGIAFAFGGSYSSVWFVDGTNRRVGRLADNFVYAVGAGHLGSRDTEFQLGGGDDPDTTVRVGTFVTGVCPALCPDPGILLDVPEDETVVTHASNVLNAYEGIRLWAVSGGDPPWGITNLPATRAWILDSDRELRTELPLVDYWTVANSQPPAGGASGHQPVLTFPARRGPGVRTDLMLAALETDFTGGLGVKVEAVQAGGVVVGSLSKRVPRNETLVLNDLLADLGIFGSFEGEIRVTRTSLTGLMWGIAQIDDGVKVILAAPGTKLDGECTVGPARCGAARHTRTVTREAGP